MVSKTDVQNAYKLILGREPDNDDVVTQHAASQKDLADLRRVFLTSEEFRNNVRQLVPEAEARGFKPLIWPKISVDVDVPDTLLEKMISRVQEAFSHLGRTDPHWSVISEDRFRTANIGTNEDEFFKSGTGVVDDLRVTASRYDIKVDDFVDCFELGSGLGRSTIWLAKRFKRVIGSDVSAIHLDLAKDAFAKRQIGNVELHHINDLRSIESLPAFDVFFSIIVLQHNPPPLIAYLLGVILSKIRPGGIGYFQVPTYALSYSFNAERYLESELKLGFPEMHVIPQNKLFELIDKCACRILEVREDGAGGPNMISSRVLVQKNP